MGRNFMKIISMKAATNIKMRNIISILAIVVVEFVAYVVVNDNIQYYSID